MAIRAADRLSLLPPKGWAGTVGLYLGIFLGAWLLPNLLVYRDGGNTLLAATGQSPASPVFLEQVEEAILALTNEVRRLQGLAPLHGDDACQRAARAYSVDMLQRNFSGHKTPEGNSLPERLPAASRQFTLWGENIWTGNGFPVDQPLRLAQNIMANWMVSSSHRRNILTPEFTHLGVGIVARSQEVRATQIFAGQARE